MTKYSLILIVLALTGLFIACSPSGSKKADKQKKAQEKSTGSLLEKQEGEEIATFAGGCFWCMESPFEKVPGVRDAVSGYTDGKTVKPTYSQVSAGITGHTEAVQVFYDPKKVSYEDLLEIFWRQIDPTDPDGQFVDQGSQYRPGIYYHNEEQRKLAEKSKAALVASKRFKKPIVVEIKKASVYYVAEDYHQDYYKKSALKYKYYRSRSGRDDFLNKWWGKDRSYKVTPRFQKDISKLTPMQFKVTQEDGTEPPFKNKYWDNK